MELGRTSNGHHEFSYDHLDAARHVANQAGGRAVFNSFNQPAAITSAQLPTGIQYFNFDTVGRQVFLPITPLLNRLPFSDPVGGTALAWREITDININKTLPGVSEGKRGGLIDRATRDRIVTFSGLGIENVSTYESMYAARGVANPKELARLDGIKALRMAMERIVLYGNRSVTIAAPAAPTGVDAVTAAGEVSTMTTRAAVVCQVVALSGEGTFLASVAAGVSTSITRTNSDGTTDTFGGGSSAAGVASAPVSVTATHKVTWTVVPVRNAKGYAWYTGAAGATRLAGVTTINQFVQFADEGGGAQLASTVTADNTKNALEFDGMLTIAEDSNSGGYFYDIALQPGNANAPQALQADGSGNIKEFIAAFYYFFTNFYFSPSVITVHPLEAYNITKILLGGPAAAIYANMITKSDSVVGGFYVNAVLNPFTGGVVPIVVHPFCPQGTIGLFTFELPYPIEKLGNIWEVTQRQGMYVIEWPARTRKDEVGAYWDGTLKCELSFGQGVIKNVKSTL